MASKLTLGVKKYTMNRRMRSLLKRTTATLGVSVLILGAAYLFFGWGLSDSGREASYRLIAYWTEANGQAFEEPFAIAVDPRNRHVLVSDSAAQRVVVFDETGQFIRQIGDEGEDPGVFENPTGIAVGPDGALYVADYDLDRIQKFNEEGTLLLSWGTSGEENDQFKLGRGHESDLRINDISVSRCHAFINFKDNKFWLQDNLSKFGTLVLVKKKTPLIPGYNKAVQIGRTVINFSVKNLTMAGQRSVEQKGIVDQEL